MAGNDKTPNAGKQAVPYKLNYTYIVKGKLRNAAHITIAVDPTEAEALARLELDKEHGASRYRIGNIEPW